MARDSDESVDTVGRLNPDIQNPFADGVDRRRVLQATGAGATAALAGCIGGDAVDGEPTVFVFNTGDRTVSVIDAVEDEVIDSAFLGSTAAFPANQYGTGSTDAYDVLWLNIDGGVLGIDQTTLEEVAEIETGFGPNYPNLTPDGEHLIVASGGGLSMDPDPDDPGNHYYYRVAADPDSDDLGEVTAEIERDYVGPCDMTVHPDGEYAFGVDVADETLSVLQIDPFETAATVDVGDSIVDGGDVLPFMCTASWDGNYLLVENGEGELGPEGERVGSESVWDISDPTEPEELGRITSDDGLPALPITSEIGPENEIAYLFIPGAGGIGVIDLTEQEYVETIDVGGASLSATWGPNREKLYVPLQSENEVAVIDHADREISSRIEVNEAPVGAIAGMTRPEVDALDSAQASLATVGIGFGDLDKTYCYPDCYCGIVL